jgi:hypothetical protein
MGLVIVRYLGADVNIDQVDCCGEAVEYCLAGSEKGHYAGAEAIVAK